MTELGNRLLQLPADTRTALAFFSRLPIRMADRPFDLSRSSAAWPVAGFILAIGPALLLPAAQALAISPHLAALVALAAMAGLTGALHEDGLADVVDGFGGGRTRERKLAIMRDSRIGAYGVLALVFAVAFKVAALADIATATGSGALAFAGAAVLSRSLALWHWHSTLPARPDGLAWAAGRPGWRAVLLGGVFGAIAAVALVLAFGVVALWGLVLAAAAVMAFTRLSVRQIGGHSGDTIGAAQQIAEVAILIALSAA